MLGMPQGQVQDSGDAGLPDSGHLLHSGADGPWELVTARREQLCAVAPLIPSQHSREDMVNTELGFS